MIGYFTAILNPPKGKTISNPTRFLQHIHMYIGYGDCITLVGHHYILTLVNRATRYV